MRANRRDQNEAELVAFWRQMGCIWIAQGPEAGFDGLLIDRSGLYLVEVKNPSTSWRLTANEAALARAVEDLGGEYHIIASLEDAAKLIGLDIA